MLTLQDIAHALGGEAIPFGRFGLVLRDAFAIYVSNAEIVLGSGVPLLCGKPKPHQRLGIILRDALAVEVHSTELVLDFGIFLLGGFVWHPSPGLKWRRD